jgi:hypothetical protein
VVAAGDAEPSPGRDRHHEERRGQALDMSGLAHLRPEQLLAAADLIAGGLAAARCCIHDVASTKPA